LSNLVCADSVLLHQAARGIGAMGGEFPVAVVAPARVWRRIGVALKSQLIGQLAKFSRKNFDDGLPVGT
jgi:hypothetical protein